MRDDPFTHNDGRVTRLLRAEGTVPIYYQGAKYNIPIKMFLPEGFPRVGPICYVTPTSNMLIKPGHGLVDGGGLVRNEGREGRFEAWRYPSSGLFDFAARLAAEFGREPPLFAKPPGYDTRRDASPSAHQRGHDGYAYRNAGDGPMGNGVSRGDPGLSRGGRSHPPPPPPGLCPGSNPREPPSRTPSRYPSPPRSPQPLYPPPPGVFGGVAGHPPPPPPPPLPPPQETLGARGYAGAQYAGSYPRPPPGVGAPPPGAGPRDGTGTSGTATGVCCALAEATFKARAVKALTRRLKLELVAVQTTASAEAERLLGVQAELARRREALEKGLREMRAERAKWEGRVGILRAATVHSEEWLAERERRFGSAGNAGGGGGSGSGDGARDEKSVCDAAFLEEDDFSRQLLKSIAKDAALEDTMDALDEGLEKGTLTLPEWLRATRQLSKEQFTARAETLVVRKTQAQRGVSGGVTFKT